MVVLQDPQVMQRFIINGKIFLEIIIFLAGMYILQKIPEGDLVPDTFLPGSYEALQRTMRAVKDHDMMEPVHIRQWEQFAAMAPKSDNVDEYLAEYPHAMRIPFKDVLFGNMKRSFRKPTPPGTNAIDLEERVIPVFETTEYVLWSDRGDVSQPVTSPIKALNGQNSGKFLYSFTYDSLQIKQIPQKEVQCPFLIPKWSL